MSEQTPQVAVHSAAAVCAKQPCSRQIALQESKEDGSNQ